MVVTSYGKPSLTYQVGINVPQPLPHTPQAHGSPDFPRSQLPVSALGLFLAKLPGLDAKGFHKEVDDFAVIKESKGGVTARASLNETLMNKFPQLRTTMGEEPVRPRKQSMPLMKHC